MKSISWYSIIFFIGTPILTYNENYEGSITIIGEKGFVKIGGVALNKILDWKFENETKTFCNVSYDVDSVYGFGHTPYYKSVADTLINGKPFLISEKDAMNSLKLLCGIVDSMNKKRIIKFKKSRS